MSDTSSADITDFPKSVGELAAFMDATGASEDIRILFRLGAAQRYASGIGDINVLVAIAAEGNAYVQFHDLDALGATVLDARASFDERMIAYIRERAVTTTQARLRARYVHIVAAYTGELDDARKAVVAYSRAIEYYLPLENRGEVDAFHALNDLIPIVVMLARRHQWNDQVAAILRTALGVKNPYLRKTVIGLLVKDREAPSDLLRSARAYAIDNVFELRGSPDLDEIDEMADIGLLLDRKLGVNDVETWQRQRAAAYRDVVATAGNSSRRQQAARRAEHIYEQLRDDEQRLDMVESQRHAAGRGSQYEITSLPVDEDGRLADEVRVALDRALAAGGPVRALAVIGTLRVFVPSVTMLRERTKVPNLRVSTHQAVTGDLRGQSWDTVEYGWLLASYAMAVAAQHIVGAGTVTVEHFISLLDKTWIGAPEERQPNDIVAMIASSLSIYVGLMRGEQPDGAIIAAVDSLTLRFEPVLRKLARLLGVPDLSRQAKSAPGGDHTLRLRSIIASPRIVEFLGEDLHGFLAYTLLRRSEGLRDRVAHGTTSIGDYSLQNLHALVFLLIRLAMGVQNRVANADAVSEITSGLTDAE